MWVPLIEHGQRGMTLVLGWRMMSGWCQESCGPGARTSLGDLREERPDSAGGENRGKWPSSLASLWKILCGPVTQWPTKTMWRNIHNTQIIKSSALCSYATKSKLGSERFVIKPHRDCRQLCFCSFLGIVNLQTTVFPFLDRFLQECQRSL